MPNHLIESSNQKLCRVCWKSGPKEKLTKNAEDVHGDWFGKIIVIYLIFVYILKLFNIIDNIIGFERWNGDILCDLCHGLFLKFYEQKLSFLNVKDEFDLPLLTAVGEGGEDADVFPDIYRFSACNEEFPCAFCIDKKEWDSVRSNTKKEREFFEKLVATESNLIHLEPVKNSKFRNG